MQAAQQRADVPTKAPEQASSDHTPGTPVRPADVVPYRNAGCGACHGKGLMWNGKLCQCAMRRFLKANHHQVEMGDDPERPGMRTTLWTAPRSVRVNL